MNTGLDFLHKDGDKCYINCQPQYWTGGNQEDLDYIKTHTTYEIIKRRCLRRPDNDFFGYRRLENDRYVGDYIWIKNKDVLDLVDTLAGGIISTLKLKKGDFVGIISSNRYEWYVSQFAMQRQGIVPVPLYPTLGKDSLNYIITTLNIKNVFCTFSKTVEEMYNSNPTLKLICYPTLKKVMSTIPSNINYINYTDLIEMGKKNPVEPDLPSLNDMFSVIFTSGTSGVPKGAIHTYSSSSHGAYVINTCGLFGSDGLLNGTYFSYLPSSHVLELEVAHAFFYGEGRVGIISGGIQTLAEDLKLCQPTFMVAVPRVLQKIFDKFTETINKSSYLTQFVYHMAYSYKLNAVKTNSWTYINWDYWVLSKVQEVFGGKLKFLLNGGAPLTPELYDWLRVCTGAFVFQGYGLTETFGGCCCSLPKMTDLNLLNVGSVCPTVEFRLVSVKDMGYSVDDVFPSGEIQIRAKQNFVGYYKNEEATKEAMTEDGFFCTGDIGKLHPDGSLCIVDRKKNLFKLAQGEYIAVEPLENKYGNVPLISQCFIYGESSDVFIIGIFVLEEDKLKEVLRGIGVEYTDDKDKMKTILNSMDVRKKVLSVIQNGIRMMNVPGYEVVKNCYFETEPFSAENDLLTPSFKLKRTQAKKKYIEITKILRAEVNKGII